MIRRIEMILVLGAIVSMSGPGARAQCGLRRMGLVRMGSE
jgi:hypothetical protein